MGQKRVWPEGDVGREARFLLGEAALATWTQDKKGARGESKQE
jgi:hypothetical protein